MCPVSSGWPVADRNWRCIHDRLSTLGFASRDLDPVAQGRVFSDTKCRRNMGPGLGLEPTAHEKLPKLINRAQLLQSGNPLRSRLVSLVRWCSERPVRWWSMRLVGSLPATPGRCRRPSQAVLRPTHRRSDSKVTTRKKLPKLINRAQLLQSGNPLRSRLVCLFRWCPVDLFGSLPVTLDRCWRPSQAVLRRPRRGPGCESETVIKKLGCQTWAVAWLA